MARWRSRPRDRRTPPRKDIGRALGNTLSINSFHTMVERISSSFDKFFSHDGEQWKRKNLRFFLFHCSPSCEKNLSPLAKRLRRPHKCHNNLPSLRRTTSSVPLVHCT